MSRKGKRPVFNLENQSAHINPFLYGGGRVVYKCFLECNMPGCNVDIILHRTESLTEHQKITDDMVHQMAIDKGWSVFRNGLGRTLCPKHRDKCHVP